METPFQTVNPSQFKLRLVWGIETGHKLVAEFSPSSWLPRKGEIMILPMDENPRHKTWHQFKVANVIYDFENQIVRVVCAALAQKSQKFEKKAEAIAASSPKVLFETLFNEAGLEEDVDEELEMLKKQLIRKPSALNSTQKEILLSPKEELMKNLESL